MDKDAPLKLDKNDLTPKALENLAAMVKKQVAELEKAKQVKPSTMQLVITI